MIHSSFGFFPAASSATAAYRLAVGSDFSPCCAPNPPSEFCAFSKNPAADDAFPAACAADASAPVSPATNTTSKSATVNPWRARPLLMVVIDTIGQKGVARARPD
ncbi:MAG: hypothetical protein ACLP8S_14135 [Solirubrobacteraceae bacterium]